MIRKYSQIFSDKLNQCADHPADKRGFGKIEFRGGLSTSAIPLTLVITLIPLRMVFTVVDLKPGADENFFFSSGDPQFKADKIIALFFPSRRLYQEQNAIVMPRNLRKESQAFLKACCLSPEFSVFSPSVTDLMISRMLSKALYRFQQQIGHPGRLFKRHRIS